ncbi:hypothetical protein CEXT_731651 [Caerostris extrusa]|uniref:Uncharacterized protein n=1 Tax=Caerostris extrusa TaxID=172846 RepID=A0AAV4R677_CAEEX|nr:hypothetical protein CEXT_731651 [Caerostris extrusa]
MASDVHAGRTATAPLSSTPWVRYSGKPYFSIGEKRSVARLDQSPGTSSEWVSPTRCWTGLAASLCFRWGFL